jgi:hypothetical protein
MQVQQRAGERTFISISRRRKYVRGHFFLIPVTVLAGIQAEKAT